MIIVLEGREGTGKTSLANRLVSDHGYVRYRAMMSEGRQPDSYIEAWREAGVPLNTFVDDVYAADMLSVLASGGVELKVILDRSLISGLAYGPIAKFDTGVLEWWEETLLEAGAALIYLHGNTDTLIERLGKDDPRATSAHLNRVESRLNDVMRYVGTLPGMAIDTDLNTADDVYAHVVKFIEGLDEHAL